MGGIVIATNRKPIFIGLFSAALACLLTWFFFWSSLSTAESVRHSFLYRLWTVLNMPIYVTCQLLSPANYMEELTSYVLTAIQWFFIGSIGARIFEKLRSRVKALG